MAKNKLQSATDQRKFVMIYHDFIESDLLNDREKMLFITLKKYADDKGKCFPSLNTLARITGNTKKRVIALLKQLEEKEVLLIEKRKSDKKGNESNIYTLLDYKEIWTEKKSLEEETDQSTSLNPQNNQFITSNNTIADVKSQDTYNVFTRDMLNDIYDYDILKNDRLEQIGLFNSLIELILEILNSARKVIRVNQEDKPIEIVKSRMLKLNYTHLIYVAEEISKQKKEIKDPRAYQLTSLFNSYTTIDLHYINKVNNDSYNLRVR